MTAKDRIAKFHELNNAWALQIEAAGFGDADQLLIAGAMSTAFQVYLLARIDGDSEEESRESAAISIDEMIAILVRERTEAELLELPSMRVMTRGEA